MLIERGNISVFAAFYPFIAVRGGVDISIKKNADAIRDMIRQTDQHIPLLETGSQQHKRKLITALLSRIEIREDRLILHLKAYQQSPATKLEKPFLRILRDKAVKLILPPDRTSNNPSNQTKPDGNLVRLMADAHRARKLALEHPDMTMEKLALRFGRSVQRFKRLLRLSYLAPDIIEAIIDGSQPASMTSKMLNQVSGLPTRWDKQRDMLEF